MDVLKKQVGADAQGAAGAQHGAVVAPADEQGIVRIGEMARQPFQYAILGKRGVRVSGHAYSSGSRYSARMTFRPKPGKFT